MLEEKDHQSRSVGGVVLNTAGMIVLVRHRNSTGLWLFPKGHAEPEETDEETARREIQEETGLTNLELLGDLGSYKRYHILPDGTDDLTELKEIKMFLFATSGSEELSPTLEIDAAKWVPLARAIDEIGSTGDKAWFASVFERVRQSVQRD